MEDFKFKKFSIQQSEEVFKVGTDGVLLGAWADILNSCKILDVGTGTGMIALMCCQRNPACSIHAIDINQEAVALANENHACSGFKNPFKATHCDFNNLTISKFDHIVSNPPYFQNSYKSGIESRDVARHSEKLSLDSFFSKSSKLLTEPGKLSMIFPAENESQLIETGLNYGFHLNRICRVMPTPEACTKRILVEFGFAKKAPNLAELVIELERHHYSESYIALTSDFYLNM